MTLVSTSEKDNADDHKSSKILSIVFGTSQESEGPYAWRRTLAPQPTSIGKPAPSLADDTAGKDSKTTSVTSVDFQTSLADMMGEAISTDAIAFNLPKLNALHGQVLQHAIKVIEGLCAKWDPMIWKVGFTHNPNFRWNNEKYGYKWGIEKWSKMIVLYVSVEPYSPSMLEAALIEKFNGTPAAQFL